MVAENEGEVSKWSRSERFLSLSSEFLALAAKPPPELD